MLPPAHGPDHVRHRSRPWHAHAHAHDLAPIPRLTQPWVVPFQEWCVRYAYFVDAIMACLKARLAHIQDPRTVNLEGMRYGLQRHLYRTSVSRYRSFTLHK